MDRKKWKFVGDIFKRSTSMECLFSKIKPSNWWVLSLYFVEVLFTLSACFQNVYYDSKTILTNRTIDRTHMNQCYLIVTVVT